MIPHDPQWIIRWKFNKNFKNMKFQKYEIPKIWNFKNVKFQKCEVPKISNSKNIKFQNIKFQRNKLPKRHEIPKTIMKFHKRLRNSEK